MMLAPIRISRLQASIAISDTNGRPSAAFLRTFNNVIEQIENALNGVIDAQNTAVAAATAAAAANDAAIAAGAAADAAQTTADNALTQAQADNRYVRQSVTPSWQTPTGAVSRSTFASYSSPGAASSYSQSQIDDLMTAVQTVSRTTAALVTDLRANKSLT